MSDDYTQTGFIHLVLIDEDEPGSPEGWRVWCIPHGPLGAHPDRVQAFLIGLEHDAAHGGGSAR